MPPGVGDPEFGGNAARVHGNVTREVDPLKFLMGLAAGVAIATPCPRPDNTQPVPVPAQVVKARAVITTRGGTGPPGPQFAPPAGKTIARAEPPPPFAGAVHARAASTIPPPPEIPGATPATQVVWRARAPIVSRGGIAYPPPPVTAVILATAESPRPDPGIAIRGVPSPIGTVPDAPQRPASVSRSEPPAPGAGSVAISGRSAPYAPPPAPTTPYPQGQVWRARAPIAVHGTPGDAQAPDAPLAVLATVEERRPEPGRATTGRVPIVSTASVAPAPPRSLLATAEGRWPQPGSVLLASKASTTPAPANPTEAVLARAEEPRPDAGAVLASHAWPQPASPTGRRATLATAEALRPEPGRVLSAIGCSDPSAVVFARPARPVIATASPQDALQLLADPGRATVRANVLVYVDPGLHYNIYENDGAGSPIDYTTAVASVAGLQWTSPALSYPGTYKFGVRAWAASLEEENVDAVIVLRLDGSGVDITARPDPIASLSVTAKASGSVRLDWTYHLHDAARRPTGFHVYQGTGGSPSYGSPVATVAYSRGVNIYTATITGLTDGVAYTFGVRAYNATAEEPGTATATATADATAPPAPITLTGTSTS